MTFTRKAALKCELSGVFHLTAKPLSVFLLGCICIFLYCKSSAAVLAWIPLLGSVIARFCHALDLSVYSQKKER